jgi:hypothetical protein
MPFRQRLPDETDQQYSLRRTAFLIYEAYLQPTEVTNSSGSVVTVLQPGEGLTEYTFNRLVSAYNTFVDVIENPNTGTFSNLPFSPLAFLRGDCFDVNPASEWAGALAPAQWLAWDCNEYLWDLSQAELGIATTVEDARFERTAYVDSLNPAQDEWEFRDDGRSVTLNEVIQADVDRQENIEAERENVLGAATETPAWVPFALAGLLGYFALRATRG